MPSVTMCSYINISQSLSKFFIVSMKTFGPGEGGSQYKGLSRDMPLKWVSKSAFRYNNDPLFNAKTGINMGHVFYIKFY